MGLATDNGLPRPPIDGRTCSRLFQEHLGLVVAPSAAKAAADGGPDQTADLPRLETRTRSHIWREWSRLGAAIAPWHLEVGDIASGQLTAPHGFLPNDYRYVVKVERPGRRKTDHFVGWLREAIADFQ